MNVVENWNALNARMKEENEQAVAGLFQIHMGAFDDLRRNGHLITANGQPASVLAATLEPMDRFSLACQIGRSLVEGSTGSINHSFAEICTIQQAGLFPNCIAIALGAMLENIHPGPPTGKMPVLFIYEIIKGNNDPLMEKLRVLEPCFPWADFRMNVKEKERPAPVQAPVLPLDQMTVLFKVEKVYKIDLGRTGFSGSVIRGKIQKGDLLTVTDANGKQICPAGVVMDLSIKDRIENGEVVSKKAETVIEGQHLDCLLLAVEMPKGSYNGMMLCQKKESRKESNSDPGVSDNAPKAQDKQSAGTKSPEKKGFFSGLFKKRRD